MRNQQDSHLNMLIGDHMLLLIIFMELFFYTMASFIP